MDEIQKIILQVENQEKLRELNAELEKEDTLLRQLVRTNAAFSTAPTVAAMEASAAKVRDLNAQIRDLEKSTGTLRTGGLLQLSYVLDDLTNTTGGWERKLASISNNIPGLVASLGGSAGIAGAIGLIGTAAIAATPVIRAMVSAFTGPEGMPGVNAVLDDAAERIKRLQGELDRILKARPFREKESAEATAFFIGDVGGAQVTRGAAAALAQAGEGAQMTAEERAHEARLMFAVHQAEKTGEYWAQTITRLRLQSARQEIQERIARANESAAGELVARAPADEGARRKLQDLARRFPGGFPKNFASQLGELTPEALDAQDEAIRADEEATREYRERKRARRKAVDEDLQLNEQADAENLREFRANRAKRRAGVDLDIQLNEEADRDNLRDWRRAKAERARAEAQEARDLEHDEAANLRDWRQAKRTRPMREARQSAISAAASLGFTGQFAPNTAEADDMARDILRKMADGLTAQQAAYAAVVGKMRQIQAAASQYRSAMDGLAGWQAHMGTGADWNGQFSAMPPMMGGGFGFSG